MTNFSNKKFISFLHSNKKFLIFILLMSVFRSAVADWYSVPTGSMKPTIQEGDRIIVNKIAYDVRLPFTDVSLLSITTPKRGEIVVFESKAAELRLVKRVIGLPGDVVEMNNEVIKVNGKPLSYKIVDKLINKTNSQNITTSIEKIGNVEHHININNTASNRLSNFLPVTVPSGHYLVLGDNRRHSADSRVYGFVPHQELRGKATAIAFSIDYNNYYIPRSDRLLQDIYGI
ncbi:signal peptidase I [Colwellia psychrerythraea]|uniref:Signal peptidase I n=1 Tax=Colwellia psychrerythraea (strain 34H / ATCC BAA-681) TaxID=167879 RepID=Q48AT9_COLP3|nr:signal peptidase I [Colwellia psychrerythraea]AAZ24810.1 signal peptidase I [Colwellia psychrerythraea 34H]